MTEVLPKIKVTGSQSADPVDEEEEEEDEEDEEKATAAAAATGTTTATVVDGAPSSEKRPNGSPELRSKPSGTIAEKGVTSPKRTSGSSVFLNNAPTSSAASDQQQSKLQTAIDPLSHHILKRTHTEGIIPPKLRAPTPENTKPEVVANGGSPEEPVASGRKSFDPTRMENALGLKEKKKGVSFLSRFMGNKKKDSSEDLDDNESELGDRRMEGMDAHVFSHPIYQGYIPQHPPPPKYIKVRAHHKRERDFNRVFLAQELLRKDASKATSEESSRSTEVDKPRTHGSKVPTSGAIWALEFSKDGRYLAVGGQDKIVKVWAVLSSSEDRATHEKEEDACSSESAGQGFRLDAPVFRSKAIREYDGHTADVLDLSWSKNNFLLSSSMDKTVRLWHVSRTECLCCFKHSDFVTSIAFHPRDDRFFLAGSLDSKLRLWSIPDKSVAFWNQLPDLITAVAFTPDGKTAMAGCLNGLCLFYETEGLKYHTQIHVKSSHGKNAKGSKITGIVTKTFPPDDPNGEIKLLITSNDSRVRLYNFRDKSLEMKFKGNENSCSQIHATFSDNASHVVCGSEDRKVYIWSTGPAESEKKDKRPVEIFAAHPAIVTTAVLAPTKTRQLLSGSGDPLYDLCNPPPVRLVSLAESRTSSNPPTEVDHSFSEQNGPIDSPSKFVSKPEESSHYLARSTHVDGNIIITADYMGIIKVFRQDCAYQQRRKESWETSSSFSKRIGSGMIGRSGSTTTRGSTKSKQETNSVHRSSDRILSWRQSIASNGSLENSLRNGNRTRSSSPHKSNGGSGSTRPTPGSTPLINHATSSFSTTSPPTSVHRSSSIERGPTATAATTTAPTSPTLSNPPATAGSPLKQTPSDPLLIQDNNQSLAFWNMRFWTKPSGKGSGGSSRGNSIGADPSRKRDPNRLSLPISKEVTRASRLSSEDESIGGSSGEVSEGEPLRCAKCGGEDFRARAAKGGSATQKLACTA
ncbi:MAG: hypothetical protein M1837_001639 [Sclerophora amabilis]|nr:MAG: hypothetical protein M1837_001639 [Sclerophora amabilis]